MIVCSVGWIISEIHSCKENCVSPVRICANAWIRHGMVLYIIYCGSISSRWAESGWSNQLCWMLINNSQNYKK